jgi:ribonuclease VapC
MIVDSSAMVAIVWAEPGAKSFVEAIVGSERPTMSAANYLEAAIVIDRDRNSQVSARLDSTISQLGVEIAPVTPSQAKIARQAYRDFGKGSGHKAQLNFGDCFAYALAAESGEPLLYKGDDFAHTGMARLV